jgi:hypothetical protein
MKFIFLIVVTCCFNVYAQHGSCFFLSTNSHINIFDSEDSKNVFAMVKQDSLKENYYSAEILDLSLKRYKVRIMSATSSTNSNAFIEGWVDKSICHIWLWEMLPTDNIYIFETPSLDSDYQDVSLDNYHNIALPILDIKNGWYYITLINGEKSISGWTKNVCTNVWGSCEHGNPYSNTP